MYQLRFTRQVAKALSRLPAKEQERLKQALRTIAAGPRSHGTKKLRDTEVYRYRTGAYRIIYGITDDVLIVVVLDVVNRSEDYEALETLTQRRRKLKSE